MSEQMSVPSQNQLPQTSTEEVITPELPPQSEPVVEQNAGPTWEELRKQFKDAGRVAISGLVEVTKGAVETSVVGAKIGIKATTDAKNWTKKKTTEISEYREAKRTISDGFKKELGKFALVALQKGSVNAEKPVTRTFRQERLLKKTVKTLEKIDKKNNKANSQKKSTHGTAPYGKARKETFLTRRSELKDALMAYRAGEIDKNELLERQKLARELIVWQGSVRPNKTVRKAKQAERNLRNSLNLERLRDVTPERTNHKVDVVPTQESDIKSPATTRESGESPSRQPEKKSALERLRKMREEGLLPEDPTQAEPKAESVKSTSTTTETSAPKEKEELSSTEKIAEIAYRAAKDEVSRLINEEDKKRTEAGKSALTEEEKAEIRKKERSIRQSMLRELTPENRKLVNRQIDKLIQQEREAREAEAKKRQDSQAAKRKEDQAKKEREKQAAAAVARNAAQTAIDS